MSAFNKRTKSNPNSEQLFLPTTGEIFPGGRAIELVAGIEPGDKPQLLYWNRTKAKIAAQAWHSGRTYEPTVLATSVYHATRLPTEVCSYGSARELFTRVSKIFKSHLDLSDQVASLVALFCLTTWLADRLPMAPSLSISGDQKSGIDLLRLLHSVCRRAIILAEVSRSGLRSLPSNFPMTLLIGDNELKPTLRRLLRVSNFPGLYVQGNRGTLVDLHGSKAVLRGPNVGDDGFDNGFIKVTLPVLSRSAELDPQQLDELAEELQPPMLQFRLDNLWNPHESRVDVSRLTPEMGRLAHALAACFPDDLPLANEAVQLLQTQDNDLHSLRFRELGFVLVEILFAEIHNPGESKVKVDELTHNANALLQSRGEIRKYSAEEVGWKLKQLEIPRRSASSGRHVRFDLETGRQVHRLARSYHIKTSSSNGSACSECAAVQNDSAVL